MLAVYHDIDKGQRKETDHWCPVSENDITGFKYCKNLV